MDRRRGDEYAHGGRTRETHIYARAAVIGPDEPACGRRSPQCICLTGREVRIVTEDSGAAGGTYTLVVELHDSATIDVGALGSVAFDPGWYAYVGSANGPGGFARVERHRELAAGCRDSQHWHIDYLLGHPDATVDTVTKTAGVDGECAVASALDCGVADGFGSSDCSCESHLAYSPQRAPLVASVGSAHESIRHEDGATTRS